MPAARRVVDPATCRLWPGQPRTGAALSAESCADLIAGLGATGRQEFPAIVRPLPPGAGHDWEIICGARRHFAVSHLRRQGVDIGFVIEPRDLDDEAAFRLADLENRARRDISDHARAQSYAEALERHYGGVQRRMAEALGVGPAWLSRHLQLARLPKTVLAAFADPAELRERHARAIARLLDDPAHLPRLEAEARAIAEARAAGACIAAPAALKRLASALPDAAGRRPVPAGTAFRRHPGDAPVTMRRKGETVTLSFDASIPKAALRGALEVFLHRAWG